MAITLDGSTGINTPTINGTAEHVTSVTGFKNRIINGAMVIDQRNAGASVSNNNSGTQYSLDRWLIYGSQASKFSVQQNSGSVTPPVGFTNYLGATSSSAYSILSNDNFVILQRIEGFNTADLGWGTVNAKTVTLSFQIYSSLTGTFGGSIYNGATNRSYPFSYTVLAANTWTTINVTIAGDTTGTWATNNTIGLTINFSLGTGATLSGTAGAWSGSLYLSATGATSVVGTSGATFYITGVQLEKGSTATSFDYRPYGTELALCQRYYQRTGGYFAATQTVNELEAVGSYSLWVPMRAQPTTSLPAGADFHRPGIAFYAASAITASVQDANGVGYTGTTIASGAGGSTSGQMRAGVILSAEL